MEKNLQTLPQIDDTCGNISTIQHYQELSTYLKQMTHFYREESLFLFVVLLHNNNLTAYRCMP